MKTLVNWFPTVRYALYGVLFGCGFVLVAAWLALHIQGMPTTVANILRVQTTHTLFWILGVTPFLLGLWAGLAGRRQDLLSRLSTQLSQANAELKRELTSRGQMQEALQQAKEAAEAANRAKGEFLANMSHTIHTAMNGIISITDCTLNTELAPEQREYLGKVRASADSLLGLLDDIRDFSKTEKIAVGACAAQCPDEVIDRAEALARLDGDEELLQEVAKLFLDSCPQRVAMLREALARGDGQALEHAAHMLKGIVGYFGATAVLEAARRVEMIGRVGDLAHAAEACAVLEEEIKRLMVVLAALREKEAA